MRTRTFNLNNLIGEKTMKLTSFAERVVYEFATATISKKIQQKITYIKQRKRHNNET